MYITAYLKQDIKDTKDPVINMNLCLWVMIRRYGPKSCKMYLKHITMVEFVPVAKYNYQSFLNKNLMYHPFPLRGKRLLFYALLNEFIPYTMF